MDWLFSDILGWEGVILIGVLVAVGLRLSYRPPDTVSGSGKDTRGLALQGRGQPAKARQSSSRPARAVWQANPDTHSSSGRQSRDAAAASGAPGTGAPHGAAGIDRSDGHRPAGGASIEALIDEPTQWQRVSNVVEGGISQARGIKVLHESASRQLDAVDYAYERMLNELQDVLPGVGDNVASCQTQRNDAYNVMSRDLKEAADRMGAVDTAAGASGEVAGDNRNAAGVSAATDRVKVA